MPLEQAAKTFWTLAKHWRKTKDPLSYQTLLALKREDIPPSILKRIEEIENHEATNGSLRSASVA